VFFLSPCHCFGDGFAIYPCCPWDLSPSRTCSLTRTFLGILSLSFSRILQGWCRALAKSHSWTVFCSASPPFHRLLFSHRPTPAHAMERGTAAFFPFSCSCFFSVPRAGSFPSLTNVFQFCFFFFLSFVRPDFFPACSCSISIFSQKDEDVHTVVISVRQVRKLSRWNTPGNPPQFIEIPGPRTLPTPNLPVHSRLFAPKPATPASDPPFIAAFPFEPKPFRESKIRPD